MHASLLSGVRVVDLSWNLPGPYATFLLASMGAEVIKVEPPKGDPGRSIGPFFEELNRGKKSVVLDLRQEEDRTALLGLLDAADVVVEGFRPGVAARLGCDAATVRGRSPRVVYCSISAFGQEGPRVAEPGHDLNLQALTGLCDLERDPAERPRPTVLPASDLSASLTAVAAITAALAARERTGEGATLDVAMGDALLSWAALWGRGIDLAAPARKGAPGWARGLVSRLTRRLTREKLYALPHYGVFRCADGAWLALGIVDEDHFWKRLCEDLGLGRLGGLRLPARAALGPLLRPLVAARLRTRSRQAWLDRLVPLDVPVSPVWSVDEATRDPQWRARGMVDERGRVRAPLPGAIHLEGRAPKLGEHTAELLGR